MMACVVIIRTGNETTNECNYTFENMDTNTISENSMFSGNEGVIQMVPFFGHVKGIIDN
jgi:hypothetical protein